MGFEDPGNFATGPSVARNMEDLCENDAEKGEQTESEANW